MIYKVVRIFTSSTFTDMLMERNTLMVKIIYIFFAHQKYSLTFLLKEWVYPKIKEYCKEKHGLEFQVDNNSKIDFK